MPHDIRIRALQELTQVNGEIYFCTPELLCFPFLKSIPAGVLYDHKKSPDSPSLLASSPCGKMMRERTQAKGNSSSRAREAEKIGDTALESVRAGSGTL
jgi:hypothetical protein